MKGCMIFAPNPSGPLHVGNAAILWLTAKEAQLRGLRFLIRIDNCSMFTTDQIPSAYPFDTVIDTLQSLKEACRLLDITPDFCYWLNERTSRYCQIIDKMTAAGTLEAPSAGYCVMRDCPAMLDVCRTGIQCRQDGVGYPLSYDPRRSVVCRFKMQSRVNIVFDAMDFNVPLHIRAHDLFAEMFPEGRLWMLLAETCKLTRQPLMYAHIPIICEPNGKPLHKSQGPNYKYTFANWAKAYPSPAALRNALERLVLYPNMPYALTNVRMESEVNLPE